MINLILFGTFFIMLFLNIPICVSLGVSSILAMIYSGDKLSVVPTNVYNGMAKFLLLAIPFFVLSGNIMAKAGISTRLVEFIDNCIGHRRGGIAIVCVVVACFFGAISGSGPATVAALGIILIPAMINRGGFSAPFSSAMMATASSIAIVIPPSIAFVVYASITGVSVGDMFMGGILPGIMMGLALVIVIMIEVRKKGLQASREKATWGARWKSFRTAFWGFLMPVIILGGIYGGIFTPTEAAAVSVVYGLIVGVFIYREVKLRDLYDLLVDSGKTTGGIMLIIGGATLFSYICTVHGISGAAQQLLLNISGNKYVFLLIVNVIFLIAGCFVDANSAMYIFIPIMFPVAQQLGIDPIHFGVLSTVNLAIGQVTPPVGVNLFVAIGVSDKLKGIKDTTRVTIETISKAVWPMIIACVITLMIVTYVPFFSTVFLGAAA
ncbi:TRAP transporter large permease [uncultured Oscillibacter sp.]|uniref:TRAP transporter large permease n=1 Tax=uncultured Oscillibacter sp. TaxID=876091 RepID=UPI0026005429|nr:TRAP transporter large permease [uncultured Oscillibacter sp.]